MSEHTRGPWSVAEDEWSLSYASSDAKSGFAINAPSHEDITLATTVGDCIPANSQRANARLLAAAPELLEACRAALVYDKAIRGKAASGDFSELNPRGAIADGIDLDALYEAWITLSELAVAKAEGKS